MEGTRNEHLRRWFYHRSTLRSRQMIGEESLGRVGVKFCIDHSCGVLDAPEFGLWSVLKRMIDTFAKTVVMLLQSSFQRY